ncbi:MAG TPA: hypothetical protein VKC54_04005 [Patescibacteria group bacterium]|nr:hypothetical protein [Patescibacteria group bacterium]
MADRSTDRNIEVLIDDKTGSKGNEFLTATVLENERPVAGIAVSRNATPEDIAAKLKKNARETESSESRDLLNQASELVPGLKKK